MAVSKPLPGQQIDRSAPYAGSLLGAWAFNEGGGLLVNDAVGVRRNSNGSAVGLTWGRLGGVFNGSNTYVDVSGAYPLFAKTSRFSGLFQFATTSATQQTLFGSWPYPNAAGWEFSIYSTGQVSFFMCDASGANYFWIKTTETFKDGKPHVAAFAYDGTLAGGASIYVDGVKRATSNAPAGTGDPGTLAATLLYIGKRNYVGGPNVINGSVGVAALWAEKLDAGYACSVTSNPWQLWPDDQIVFAPASGINVTPDPATLTLTGYAPTVTAPAAVTPTPASLTLTGYAPTVTAPASITPTPATLTLTGYPPTVTTSAATNDSEWIITARRRGRR